MDPKNDGLEADFRLTMGIFHVVLQVVYHVWMAHYLQRFLNPNLCRLFLMKVLKATGKYCKL